MPADPKRVETIFNAALAVAPADRAAFLAAECGADAELRARVERLLAAHAELEAPPGTASFAPDAGTATFDGPAPAPTDAHTPQPDAGTVLAGKYKLLEEIGEGGMGTVWMAEQTEPVRRRVAVKLIKPGMDSRAVLARFEAERQALALMDHPNIAKVFDAGAAPDGRPFFVMELVKGVPITEFCDARKLTPRERLELFVPVCQAIQHAHQKGVIHRDIKPSNVLVALYDDRPVPKVIDFGVSKATGQPLTEKTLATGFGAVVGTAEYMSPEQANFNNLDIDTRSDVYALGVLLYELLAGSPPFSRTELEKKGLLEIFRVIREQEPPRPSTKLSTADALPTLSANRGTEPAKLTRLLRGELDWIVMKALEKDRNRRYESANGFAADVQRYLAGEPVQAVPPSAGYRLKKFLRRNRGPVIAVGVVFLALVAGIAATSAALVYAVRARNAAETAETNERHERTQAEIARKDADEQRMRAERQAISATIDLLDQPEDNRNLLQMARLVKSVPAHAGDLRQFLVMKLILEMQRHYSLAPNLEGTGGASEIQVHTLRATRDGRHLVGNTRDGDVAVWEAVTHRRVARLREGNEFVELWGTDPARRLVYTAAKDHVVRVWEVPSGRLLLRTPTLFDDFHRVVHDLQVWQVRMTDRHLLVTTARWPVGDENATWVYLRLELWNIAERKRVATLPGYFEHPERAAFSPDGSVLVTGDAKGLIRVWRTSDGALVKTLPPGETVYAVAFSPSGQRLLTLTVALQQPWGAKWLAQWWRTDTWEPDGVGVPTGANDVLFFPRDDTAIAQQSDSQTVLLTWGIPTPFTIPGSEREWVLRGNRLCTDRWVLDLTTRQLSQLPLGHRYHPEATAFADDGRWLVRGVGILDLAVQKPLTPRWLMRGPPNSRWPGPQDDAVRLPQGGYLWADVPVVYIPPPTLDVPADVLELWAQVILRSELAPDGEIRKWDEQTWDRKWRELVALATPAPNFPFPGRIVGDRWYWVRTELESLRSYDTNDKPLNTTRRLEYLNRLIPAEPTASAHWHRAELLEAAGRWQAAADDSLAAYRLGVSGWQGYPRSSCARVPGQPAERYQANVRLAEAAHKDNPRDWAFAEALGLAYYRVGRYREAITQLRDARAQNRPAVIVEQFVGPRLLSPLADAVTDSTPRESPATLAFLAMTHHKLGEVKEARDRLAELRAVLAAGKWDSDADVRVWLQEAIEVVEGKR